jgi:tetratricopeptide (TPR) repeat protein
LEQRDFDEATEHFEQSSQLCETLNDLAGIAQNQCDLARIAVEQANYDAAKRYLLTSRSIRESLMDKTGVAEVLHVEARMYHFRGKHAETIELGEQALAILESSDKEEKAIRTLSLLASAYIMQKDFEMAEFYARYALQLSEKFQDKGDKGVILSVLSYIAHRQNNLEKALKYGEESLHLLQTIGDLGSQAMTYYTLGRIYQAKKQYNLALEVGFRSLDLCQQSDFELQKGWTLTHIARCYEGLGHTAQAQEHLREAWSLAQSLQNSELINNIILYQTNLDLPQD